MRDQRHHSRGNRGDERGGIVVHKKIAYIGIGVMGQGMVLNLIESGHYVTVWNRTPARAEAMRAHGAADATIAGQRSRERGRSLLAVSVDPTTRGGRGALRAARAASSSRVALGTSGIVIAGATHT
jgi:UDP-N-acetylmuramoylalanine-D-glutamate ligase